MHNLFNLTVNYLLQPISTQVKKPMLVKFSAPYLAFSSDWFKQYFGYRSCRAVTCQVFSSVYRKKSNPFHSAFSGYR